MDRKMFYEAPDAELIELKLEGNLLDMSFNGDDNTETFTDDGDENL